jgi:hypothetical protein
MERRAGKNMRWKNWKDVMKKERKELESWAIRGKVIVLKTHSRKRPAY